MSEPQAEPQEQEPQEQDGPEPQEPVAPAEPSPEEEEAAEAEEAASEPEEPVEGHPEAMSQKDIEKVYDKFKRENARHHSRIVEIMGEAADGLMECPLCDPRTPGFVWPTPDTEERFPTVRAFMGDAAPRQLRPDPDTHQCETCSGEGMLDMQSKVQGQEALVCGYCGGKGWVGTRHSEGVPLAPTSSPAGNGVQTGPLAESVSEPPEVQKLRAEGYLVMKGT